MIKDYAELHKQCEAKKLSVRTINSEKKKIEMEKDKIFQNLRTKIISLVETSGTDKLAPLLSNNLVPFISEKKIPIKK